MLRAEMPSGEVIDNPSEDLLRQQLIEALPALCQQGTRTAVLDYEDEEKGARSLLLFLNQEHGIYLKYLLLTNHRVTEEWLSLSNRSALEEWVDLSDEWYASVGLFLPVEAAWEAICEFRKSGERSIQVEWVHAEDMPEDSNW
ncbi:hypothetical protein [Gorillibacterium sp. CAU 1737]|uniref:hypothetical protein n=1 Tax=Gorillibacterium sp. CAU 1737 TaxID=3140362 RepID=UPI0032601702